MSDTPKPALGEYARATMLLVTAPKAPAASEPPADDCGEADWTSPLRGRFRNPPLSRAERGEMRRVQAQMSDIELLTQPRYRAWRPGDGEWTLERGERAMFRVALTPYGAVKRTAYAGSQRTVERYIASAGIWAALNAMVGRSDLDQLRLDIRLGRLRRL